MNIEKERELFESRANIYGLNIKRYCNGSHYEDNKTQTAWALWRDSTNREGYKFVPFEMSWCKADELAAIEWDNNRKLFISINRELTGLQTEEYRLRWCRNKAHEIMKEYKAMIGASE